MINHDLHIHTHISLCGDPGASAEGYIEQAIKQGFTTIGFSDHFWDSAVPGGSRWYSKQDYAHICQLKAEVPTEHRGVRLLFGCEADCKMDGVVGISEEVAREFDFIIVAHGHDNMKNFVIPEEYLANFEEHARFSVKHFKDIVNSPLHAYFTAVAHPFVPGTRHEETNSLLKCISDADFRECFQMASDRNIAIEMNGSIFIEFSEEEIRNIEYVRMFSIAKECGCTFTYGSDSHWHMTDRQLHKVELMKTLCGISDENFLNADRLESKTFING